ncbi:MAG: PDZ domain-containing protein, partial [Rikenellaceae bacterium]
DRMGPNNIVTAWTNDSKEIVYRNRISSGFDGKLYTVDKEGGLSTQIPLPEGGFCSYSPDGTKLAYNRVMREFRTWKRYEGGMADDVWVYDSKNQEVANITNNPAQDVFPMWIGQEIYYISDRDKVMNLFVYNTETKENKKVTSFDEYDIKFPSHHGDIIVFENGGYIYKYDVKSGKSAKIEITLKSDNVYARGDIKDGADYITNLSASPNGERIAVTTRGEVFDVPVKRGVVKNVSRTPGANERLASFSPDSVNIAYVSDITGETEIYLYDVVSGESVQVTKKNDSYITSIKWSPNGEKIVYTDRKNRLKILDIASKKSTLVWENSLGGASSVSFSPDNKWLTYSRVYDNGFSIVYIYNLAEKKEYAITDRWYSSSSPVFSQDGKYIVFSSSRDFNPTYGQTEWNHTYSNMGGVYFAILDSNTPSPFLESDASSLASTPKKSEGEKGVVVFDENGLGDRILKLPLNGGYYSNFYSDNNKIYYYSRGNTYIYDLDKKESNEIISGGYMSITPGSDKALIASGKKIMTANIPSSKVNIENSVNLDNIKIPVDYTQEWQQIFDETWRAFRDGFYLENMHGHDWKAIGERYKVLLPYVKTRLDLNYVIGEMISELGVGHAYINPGEYEGPERINMGLLGAEISRDKSGYFRLEKILKGASWSKELRSPLTENGIDVSEGDYIIAIDGVETSSVKDMFSLLVGKAGIPTELTINGKPAKSGARKVVIVPIDNEYPLYHYSWVQRNIEIVDKASNGKIGYIYIPDMGVDGLNEFSRYFYPQLDKEGLIIDDRANGGGNVSPMILERLAREPYRLTMGRHTTKIGTVPNAVQVGPKVCLINKYSASDGDLFPWGFRALGLGKLIGTRTWGGVIGISGSLPYMDGTDVRVPFFTSFDAESGDWIIENYGVDPDIEIDNDPIKEFNGEDQQLLRAIEEVMKDLETRKPIATVPAPRNWAE